LYGLLILGTAAMAELLRGVPRVTVADDDWCVRGGAKALLHETEARAAAVETMPAFILGLSSSLLLRPAHALWSPPSKSSPLHQLPLEHNVAESQAFFLSFHVYRDL